jgi:DNA-directed RNA polymerase subunit RPC12/RpoP
MPRSAHTKYLCVLCGSENKQRLFHCTVLTDWLVFITETECVFCAVRSTFYVLPTRRVYVFCVDLRTNSDYFTVQHWLVGFYNWDECVYCAVRSSFYVLPTQWIYVFCVDLRTNSDYFTVQHWLVGFCNWDGVCLLRGTFYILRSAHTVYLCVLCGSENKQRLFHCTALTDWFL